MEGKAYEAFYDWMSGVYNPPMTLRHFLEDDRYQNVVEYVRETGDRLRILDAGCGNGWLASLYRKGHTVHGIDISDINLRKIRDMGIQPLKHDLDRELPLRDGAYDVVVCSEILEHILSPEHLLREVFRVLRPGGACVLTVPNLHCIRNRIDVLAGKYTPFVEYRIYADRYDQMSHVGVQHIHHYTLEGMTSVLKTVGFRDIRAKGESFHLNFLLPFRVLDKLHGGDRGLRAARRLLAPGKEPGEFPGLELRLKIIRALGKRFPTLSCGLVFKALKP